MSQKKNVNIVLCVAILLSVAPLFQNCNPVRFNEAKLAPTEAVVTSASTPATTTTTLAPPSVPTTTITITSTTTTTTSTLPLPPTTTTTTTMPPVAVQTFKPALAVRGISCLMCHAQIQSNVITDFGAGDAEFFPNYMAGSIYSSTYGSSVTVSDVNPFTLPWYGNYFAAWQTAQITGTVYIPKVAVNDQRTLNSVGLSGPTSLKNLMALDFGPGYYGVTPYSGNSGSGAMESAVTPAPGNSKVQEVASLHIGAPTEVQILGLTKGLSSQSAGWEGVSSNSVISGLSVATGQDGKPYVTHASSQILCKGDVVIKGTLFLNNVTISTDKDGCRLMVTQSVFIQGQILFQSPISTENLQISSARSILIGFDVNHIGGSSGRFVDGRMNVNSHPLTRGAGTNSEKNTLIIQEANNLGNLLRDSTDSAGCPTSMLSYSADQGGSMVSLNHCQINFERLLLNAPQVHSRYVGEFKGVTIAEIALFAPGALRFKYDPIFDSVTVLPKLGSTVLNIMK